MSRAFTFGFHNNGVEEDGHHSLSESQTDIRENSAMPVNPHLEAPKVHSLQDMV